MSKRPGLFRVLRNKFVAGLIILVPLVITGQALWWLFAFLDNFARPWVAQLINHDLPGVGFIATVLVVLAAGLLFSAGPLKRLLDSFEEVIEYMPMV